MRILVVDDEKAIRRYLRVALSAQDITVVEASNGEEAIRAVAVDRPDMVILDLGLPDMEGTEVTRRIREWSAVPIIILSVREQESDKIAALDSGADDYLTKPFKLENLKATIQRGLESQAIKRENVALRSQLELMKVAREYAQGMKLRPLLELVVNSAVQVLPAQAASILLRNRKTDSFYLVNMAGDTAEEAIPKFLLGDNEKFREVLNNRRPLTGQQEIDIEGKTFKRSLLSYPLISHGEVIGLLNLVYTDRYSFISPGQKRMLSLLVSTAASAVEANFLNRDLRKSYFQTIKALANAIEARDRYTAGHTDRV